MTPTQTSLTDDELLSKLKHLAAMWFSNSEILLLEELFRRYQKAKAQCQHLTNTNPKT